MTYKGTHKTAGEIGSELGASYIVESTVRRDPQRVRITAKLIRVKDQVQVWSNIYDREPSGLLGSRKSDSHRPALGRATTG
jgi:TolB-like protein